MSIAAFGLFLAEGTGKLSGTQVPGNYHAYGAAAAIIIFVAIMTSAVGTHSTIPWLQRPVDQKGSGAPTNFFKDLKVALSSQSAVMILMTGMLFSLSLGLLGGITPYVYSYFFELKPQQISLLYGATFLSAFAALAFTPWLAQRFEKRQAFIWITVAAILTTPSAAVLQIMGLLPPASSSGLVPLLFVLGAVATTFMIIQGTLFSSMTADVIEENEVRTGRREEGVFFAANIFVRKCVSGLGVFATSALLVLANFPEKAVPGAVPESVLNHLVLYFTALFFILNIAAIACILAFKITRARHAANLEILAGRRQEMPAR